MAFRSQEQARYQLVFVNNIFRKKPMKEIIKSSSSFNPYFLGNSAWAVLTISARTIYNSVSILIFLEIARGQARVLVDFEANTSFNPYFLGNSAWAGGTSINIPSIADSFNPYFLGNSAWANDFQV